MSGLLSSVKRNCKLFFKDRGMFISSLITPIILLVLYMVFLSKVFKDSFTGQLNGVPVPDKLVNGFVAAQLCSSLLAVCCITVAFCSNLLMVQDKVTGARGDILITPANRSVHALGYYLATAASTLIVCLVALCGSLIYMACSGWYSSFGDILLSATDVVLLVMFGTALSSVLNFFLSTQGQMQAVGTIVSAGYGFVCGAYMPISQYGSVLQNVLGFLPGTYGTALIRNHMMAGAFREMQAQGWGSEVIDGIRGMIDADLSFFGNKVELWVCYLVVILSVAALIGLYVLLNVFCGKKKK
ncbi:MAG: ABC transporter permease [Clostridiales bacterium]|nr:ABC transporter permease [Clostridiales bacterium]